MVVMHQQLAVTITDNCDDKVAPRFYSPYKVLERMGNVAYRLALPPRAHIHRLFHVVFLKKNNGDPPAEVVPPPPIQNCCVLLVPTKVIKARLNRGSW